ncbi:MAG TPA: DUF4190 domain-containing protein [Candidatus Methylacidiphilales bacterium]|jgi:amino acid transporter|nr:DUF4190 domain-containing protein [Candidatus Methylacidiphilales bacterium]
MAIYVQRNSQKLGPYTLAELRSQLASGALSLKDYVWWTGQTDWIPLVGSPVLKPGFEDPDPAMKKKSDEPSGLSPFSVAAVVAGLIFPMAFFTSIPAIIFGICALDEMRKYPARTGRGMAILGLALGVFFTLTWGAAVGCWYYFRDDIEAMNMRQQAVESQPFVPSKTQAPAVTPAPVANPAAQPTPATNAAPVSPGR